MLLPAAVLVRVRVGLMGVSNFAKLRTYCSLSYPSLRGNIVPTLMYARFVPTPRPFDVRVRLAPELRADFVPNFDRISNGARKCRLS